MNKKDLFQQITVFIQAGKIAEAFEFINQQKLDTETLANSALIQGEYLVLIQDELKGTISSDERQIRRNRINDKLINLFKEQPKTGVKSYFASPLLKVMIPLVLLTIATLIWWKVNFKPYVCPDFPSNYNNKVMVLPFDKAGANDAKPELILNERINKITTKNDLSTKAEIGTYVKNISTEKAASLVNHCQADLIIWGNYSAGTDSTRLIINYKFSENSDWNNTGDLVAVKDVTELYNGRMLKDMDDAIMSLCGLIAIKEGNGTLASKWFNKVKNKEELDNKMLDNLKQFQ